jgi:hypothetical protein
MKVDYNLVNMEKCVCCKCKVQKNSGCPRKRTKNIQKMESDGVDTLSILKPNEFPWLYCAVGRSICEDLDYNEDCICEECTLWKDYGLDKIFPKNFYCREGIPE